MTTQNHESTPMCGRTTKSVLSLFATVILFVAADAPLFAQRLDTDRPLPTQQQLSRFGLERAWSGQATMNPSRDKVRNVSIDEDMVYVQSTSGFITAFDSETGHKRWDILLGRHDQPSYQVVSNEDVAMVVVGSTMYAIQKKTGRPLWQLILPGQPSTAPGIDETQVYIGTLDGGVYAFSLRKIRRLYQEQRLPQYSHETQVWHAQAGKEITSPPLPSGRAVNFCSRDGSLYSVSAIDKHLFYQIETNGAIVAPLASSGKVLYMASEDFTFFALNALNGNIIWEFTSGLPIRKAPFVIGNDLFLAPDRGGMYCLDAGDGTQRWWQPSLQNFLAVIDDSMYASDQELNLIKVSRGDGAITGSLPLRNFTTRIANDRTDRIFMSTQSGLLIALRKRGSTIPVFHKFPDRLPILPEIAPEEPTEEPTKTEDPAAQ